MNILGNNNYYGTNREYHAMKGAQITSEFDVKKEEENDPLSLKKAIKAYQDEVLTGLTDEEKAEIEKLSKEYLKNNPIKTEHDKDAFNEYVKSLLKKFGFKGDIDEYAAGMAAVLQEESEKSNQPSSNAVEHFQKSSMDVMAARNKFLSY